MKFFNESYDIIVLGAGHAGCEAALAAARMGMKTALLTMNLDTIARMSCNPSIGGIGKGHLVKEIDALGGEMAKAIDSTGIQFRRLNTRKGPAVQASRAQADRMAYHRYMRRIVESTPQLHVRQGMVIDFIISEGNIAGVKCFPDIQLGAKAVINAAGTFLNGLIHIGLSSFSSGRDGEFSALEVTDFYRRSGFTVGRLKTGTPPRINGHSVDYSLLVEQCGDPDAIPFSFSTDKITRPQVSCFITQTTEETHEIIRRSLDRSPLYSGIIVGTGPRYCPSIETKVIRFPDRTSHHIFLEPEGLETNELYVNGISTSLPYDVQRAIVRSIPGLENAEITRPGYAIEYDFFPPTQLSATLETKQIGGLFHAGQINGTSGYEEAAAQGIIAGINAVHRLRGAPPFILGRHEAYIAVMIDDLISQGVIEPYRMFTSRSEFRLLLREDNADERLMKYGRDLGLISDETYRRFQNKCTAKKDEMQRLETFVFYPESDAGKQLEERGVICPHDPLRLKKLVARPDIDYGLLRPWLGFPDLESHVIQSVEYDVKYEGYINRQREQVKKFASLEQTIIPDTIVYHEIQGLTIELRERLSEVLPRTLGQASRIPGMTPAALTAIMIGTKTRISIDHAS